MAKDTTEKPVKKVMVTERTRKPREGFVNPNRGIEVAPGLNLQDVPRAMLQAHLKMNEQLAKQRFQAKYGHMGGQQSF